VLNRSVSKEKKMGRACCVPGCGSGVNVPGHKFPKNPIRCAEWVNNLNLEHLKNYSSSDLQKLKVCYKHFHETAYSCSLHHRFLKDTAIPFIHVNNQENINQENTNQEHVNNQENINNQEHVNNQEQCPGRT